MKNFSLCALIATLSLTPVLASAATPKDTAKAPTKTAQKKEAQKPVRAVATKASGRIQFRLSPKAKWAPLVTGTILPVGAEVLAGPGGKAKIQMGPSVTLTLKPFSRITIAQLSLEKVKDVKTLRATLAKQYGRVIFDVRAAGFQNDFKIASPNGVMAVKGTGGEHAGFGRTERVTGVRTNKNHAIAYTNAVAGYKAFLSANEGISDDLPSVEAFGDMLRQLPPAVQTSLFMYLGNQQRGEPVQTMGLGEWQALIQQAHDFDKRHHDHYTPRDETSPGGNISDSNTLITGY